MFWTRSYLVKDAEAVQEICIALANKQLTGSKMMRNALLDVFCRYYIEKEPQNCFVAIDDADQVKGYILCSENYKTYEKVFTKCYLSTLNPMTKMMGRASMLALSAYAEEYPAHLHIDLLPECQGQGVGTALIESVCEYLTGKGVKGVMLDVASDNTGAQQFYLKCGFEVLKNGENEILMGRKLV